MAEHETGECPTWLWQRELLSDLSTRFPKHLPIQTLGYFRCPGHRDNQETLIAGESDFVFRTKLGPACRSSYHNPPDRPEFRRTDWANFQTHLEELIPLDSELHNKMAIDTWFQNFSGPFWRLWQRQLPSIARVTTHGLRYWPEFRMRYAWKASCGGSGSSPGTPVFKPSSTACRGRWSTGSTSVEMTSRALHSNPSILKTNRCGGWQSGWWQFLLHITPDHPRRIRCLRLWKSRSPCRQSGSSVSAGDRSFGLGSYWDGWRGSEVLLLKPCQLTSVKRPWRGSRNHQGSQAQQGSGPVHYNEQAVEASSQASGFPPRPILNAVLRTPITFPDRKHDRVISILHPGKNPVLPSTYRPINLLDTIGKLFEKIVLARILHVAKERGLMRDDLFGFRPKYSTSLQLTRLVERINRNFGEKRLTGAVFLDFFKAFDTVRIDGLLYKLTLLNFPSYIVHTISSYLRDWTFKTSFQKATTSRRGMRAGVAQGDRSPLSYSVCISTFPHHRTTSSWPSTRTTRPS